MHILCYLVYDLILTIIYISFLFEIIGHSAICIWGFFFFFLTFNSWLDNLKKKKCFMEDVTEYLASYKYASGYITWFCRVVTRIENLLCTSINFNISAYSYD